jgi:hypothetical protein
VPPAVGTNTIQLTFSGNVRVVGGAVSFTGVDQTTSHGAFTPATGTSTIPSVTVASSPQEMVIDTLNAKSLATSVTVGAGQTQQWYLRTPGAGSDTNGAGSTEPGASSVTMSWTLDIADHWALGAISLKNASNPSISSAANQTFTVGDPGTVVSTITITDDPITATITAANDIRIRIPAGFNMSWNTFDTTATIGGGASSKVSTTISYEDGGKTQVIDVTSNFAAGDQITVSGLSFRSFAAAAADNFELEVSNADTVAAYDDKTIVVHTKMKMTTGSYTGNGIAGTAFTGLGFQPDVVIIKAADDTQEAVCHTAGMSGDLTKPMGGAAALAMYLIQSLDSDGFTFGNDDRVNKSGITYHWIAFKAGPADLKVDTYSGTGVDGTSVTGVGFQPDYVIVMSALARAPVHRSSAQSGDTSLFFNNTASAADHIQALEADGFQVGGDARVNTLDETYHYIAWKAVAGKMAVGLHPGDGNDDTNITGLGFEPEYVVIKQDNNKEAVHRPASLSGDSTLWFVPTISASNMIQQLQSDGFQVGNNDRVNKNGETYFWVAFAGSHLTITSAADQTFNVGDPLTAISTITITEGIDAPTITALDDIRIRIPAGFNMTWDTIDLAAVIGGGAAAKVAPAVAYEDSGLTLVLNVTADFAAGDQVTVAGLGFTGFTATSAPDNLELEVENDGTAAAYDKKTIRIGGPLTISSAADQVFTLDDPATAAATIAVTDDFAVPQITAGNELRIRIPTGFNMTWDASVTTVTIGGSAAAKVSTTVQAYEDGDQTLVLDVTANFAAGEYITLAGAQFTDFSAVSPAANLEVDVKSAAIQRTLSKSV